LGEVGIGRRMILKYILREKSMAVWTGFTCLRIGFTVNTATGLWVQQEMENFLTT
jgi:hypothetical protein